MSVRGAAWRGLLLITGALVVLPAAAEPLGRLFLTPERRTALERQRQANIQESQSLEGAVMSLDGTVVRSSGKATVWVSGRPQHDMDGSGGVAVNLSRERPGEAVLAPGDEAPARLRVGESINRATREKTDGLGGGTIVRGRRKD